jgi:hypothetical protein
MQMTYSIIRTVWPIHLFPVTFVSSLLAQANAYNLLKEFFKDDCTAYEYKITGAVNENPVPRGFSVGLHI